MSWRNIFLIFHREVLDQLRDRRTLFMVAVLPLLLYPLLGIGMVQMTVLFTEQPRNVLILGASDLPPEPLVSGDRFAETWFLHKADVDKLHVITDANAAEKDPSKLTKEQQLAAERFQKSMGSLREQVIAHQKLAAQLTRAHQRHDAEQIASGQHALRELNAQLTKQLEAGGVQVLILIPQEFSKNLAERQSELSHRDAQSPREFDYARPVLVRNSADEKSAIAFRRVESVLAAWERSILKAQLKQSHLPESLTEPIRPDEIDLAEQEQVSANVWAKMLPALLVLMTLTGAFYPAIDLCAGEKERGTMETLLICPATRTEIVLGKFLTVMIFSASTAILNLVSVGFTGKYMASLAVAGASRMGDLSLPPFTTLLWIMVILVPLVTLFSALCLAIATFAKSTKEGQYYLTPLLMATLGLTMFCLSPATEMHPFYSVMPVIGPGLLLKGLMKASGPAPEIFVYAAPVLITSIGYSLLALWWAIEQFGSEDVLFREAERFDLRLWVKHLLRDKEPTPTFAEAGFCFLLILILQFVSWKSFQTAMQNTPSTDMAMFQIRLLIIQQVALIASPALFMGFILTSSLRQTFALRWPGYGRLLCAALLPFTLHPLTSELVNSLDWFFPPPPAGMIEMMKQMKTVPLPLVLLAFAVTPAVCEELAFRGFLLAGLRRSGRIVLAIVLSSCAFGIIHMIPHQVFNATLLGLVLGLICVRSRSLFPGVAFHFVYNSLGILHDRLSDHQALIDRFSNNSLWPIFFRWQDQSLRYQPTLLVILFVLCAVLLQFLIQPSRHDAEQQ